MISYCCKRILTAVPVLLGISLLAFILGVLSPGDPAEFVLNQDGLYAPSEEQLEAMREELGLNKPLWLRYGLWLMGVLQGDLGSSYITGRDIAAEIAQRLPVTLELAVLALLMAGVGGIFLGSICAVYRGSFFDNFFKNLTNVMLSIPGFWLALILILIFSEQLRWLPTSGTGSLKYFLLPAFVLAFATMSTVCRFMRGALLTEFGRQYFLVAKVRGINKFNLLTRYALPNAIIPVIALLGNYFASVLGGSVIAESIFAIPGISSMALEAIRYRDYPVLQAYVLVSGCTLILVMVTVDLLIAYLNPKVKLGERSRKNQTCNFTVRPVCCCSLSAPVSWHRSWLHTIPLNPIWQTVCSRPPGSIFLVLTLWDAICSAAFFTVAVLRSCFHWLRQFCRLVSAW